MVPSAAQVPDGEIGMAVKGKTGFLRQKQVQNIRVELLPVIKPDSAVALGNIRDGSGEIPAGLGEGVGNHGQSGQKTEGADSIHEKTPFREKLLFL